MTGMVRGGVAVGDGSWTLTVFVTDLQVERRLRVKGDLHIGGVMLRLVDELGKTRHTHTQANAIPLRSLTHGNFSWEPGIYRVRISQNHFPSHE
jgi:hypothetical protein